MQAHMDWPRHPQERPRRAQARGCPVNFAHQEVVDLQQGDGHGDQRVPLGVLPKLEHIEVPGEDLQ